MHKQKFFGRLGKAGFYKDILMKADSCLHSQIMEEVEKSIDRAGKILDLGAGEGALSLRLKDRGYNVLASDIDERIFKCQDEIPFIAVDFNDSSQVEKFIRNYEGYFDVVLGIEVIEHVENPWNYIRLMKKLVKKDGKIIVSTPNISSWLSRLKYLFTGEFVSFSDNDWIRSGHINPITALELTRIFQSECFDNIKVRAGGNLPVFVIGRSYKMYFLSILNLILRPLMGGVKDGWCIIVTAEKKAFSQCKCIY